MRTHEDDAAERGTARGPERSRTATAAGLAQRVIAGGATAPLTADAVMRLQRTAGNEAVDGLLTDNGTTGPRSPVLDVVGKGGGRPLDAPVRAEMEGALGDDFGDVRVHTDAKASASAKAVQAQAYTVAHEVVFADGGYAPATSEGKRTLAHELTHVVQQRSGPVEGAPAAGGISVSDPSDRFERAADEAADRVVSEAPGHRPDLAHTPGLAAGDSHGSLPQTGVQRQEAPEEEMEEPQ